MSNNKTRKRLLFLALFTTGLAGIVAEYCFATMATYFGGDSVTQWAIVISLMLFSMGLGSRISSSFQNNLLTIFVAVEFLLSILVSFSAVSTYYLATQIEFVVGYIYFMSVVTGILIGMELPLAIRINEQFQHLKFNVAHILEKDYYGSLIGGLFFVFIGMPYLGLSNIPFILGFINLLVALILIQVFKHQQTNQQSSFALLMGLTILVGLIIGFSNSEQIILRSEQNRYKDKIVHQDQSLYQKIVVTEWKGNNWLYLDDHLQFSTFDEALYHETITHPVYQLLQYPKKILILGGGDGCAARELLKYPKVESIVLVDIDKKLTDLFSKQPKYVQINQNALNHPKVKVINEDGFKFIEHSEDIYDLILVDLPDPRSVELCRLYSEEFYRICYNHLTPKGGIITQAGSPYYTPKAYHCIEKTIGQSGFNTLPIHNQILSMGEWGWVIGFKGNQDREVLINRLNKYFTTENLKVNWISKEAINLITSFGQPFYLKENLESLKSNTINNPILYGYYLDGNWESY